MCYVSFINCCISKSWFRLWHIELLTNHNFVNTYYVADSVLNVYMHCVLNLHNNYIGQMIFIIVSIDESQRI